MLVQPLKKVRNKVHIKTLICKTYIVGKISTFISYYFKHHLRIRINYIPRYDGGGQVFLSRNSSILSRLR